MRISVVIPAYQAEKYIAETIASVLRQTLRPVEIIVVDDGSPDRCAEIAASYPEVQVVRQGNAGVANARNAGMAVSSGDWLAFLDADDIWESTFLEESAAALTKLDADVCYTARRHLTQQRDGSFLLEDAAVVPPSPDRLGAILPVRGIFMPTCVVLRRRALEAVGGFDQNFTPAEDWEMWLRLLRSGARFVQVREPLVQYRVHTASASFNPHKTVKAAMHLIDQRVLPHLPRWRRPLYRRRSLSRFEGEAALVIRDNRQPGALRMMIQSICRHPFHDPRRYKFAAHMLLIGAPVSRDCSNPTASD